ncbi:HU family DNA-binding protein [Micrococcaceae bacterium Sec7.4]
MTEKTKPEKKKPDQNRVSKREFLAQVSGTSEIPLRTVTSVYDAILDELLETMRRGDALMLTGFGKFYPQSHAGHRVQFAGGGGEAIDDYFVLKFSATRAVNKSLLEAPREERAAMVELLQPPEGDEIDDAEFEPQPRPRAARKPKPKAKPDDALSLAAAAVKSSRSVKRAQTKAERDALRPPVHKRAI